MAKNKVQFQKSMNIHAFIQRYGNEDLCQQRLFDIRWPQGFRCPNCGQEYLFQNQYWLTKNTLPHAVTVEHRYAQPQPTRARQPISAT